MQIISYVDSNTVIQFDRASSIEKFLQKQPANGFIPLKKSWAEAQPTVKIMWINVAKNIAQIIKSIKIYLYVLLAMYILLLLVPFAFSNIISFFRPVKVNVLSESEMFFLDTAMKNYATGEKVTEIGDDGFIDESSNIKYAFETVTYKNYVVQPGDNITKISKKFGLSNISTIISVNKISSDRGLMAGDVLTIPSTDGIVHTVLKNESLSGIAQKYKVAQEGLMDANDLSSIVLKVGQQVFIPGACLDSDTLKMTLGILFACPIKGKWRLTSPYGYRLDPFTGVKKFHTGMDMACPQGTPIYSTMDGKIIEVSYNAVFGNYVIISHANGYQTLYAHMHSTCCKKGDRVTQGTKIGLVGSTGYSTGSHLHFTVYKNGKLMNPQILIK
ncbi:MAG: peptidoglycan DD-metalloendopeptidase family protein [Treponemataceae bacterium]